MKTTIAIITLLVSVSFLTGCFSEKKRKNFNGIEKAYAEKRSKQVTNVQYKLEIDLTQGSEFFTGENKISFKANNVESDITFDFNDGKILSIKVNGKADKTFSYNNNFITIKKKLIRLGQNDVLINYTHEFSKTGSGLYRSVDPVDKLVYFYTDFEPYDANLLFPCFDQPDIKATYQLEVTGEKNWIVISSVKESGVKNISDKKTLWTFPESKKYSTYIFSMHAGPYKVWKDKFKNIDLRLMSRKSFAKYVNEKDWFLFTKQGFGFFNEYFDYNYPFVKYDQIIVPDFNSGAMENVAAVTFNEGYTPKGKATQQDRERTANVIFHEMAHMWFGNLVTMKWWDDLWLNESFATFMAYMGLSEATEFKKSWKTFYGRSKNWGYWEDQLVTTHPIVTHVSDTERAAVNFDGISYGKGASVLQQLQFLLGAENFKLGVQKYFKKYAYQNTEMNDFVSSLSQASSKDLSIWTEQWLEKPSLNYVSVEYKCVSDKIESITLNQSYHKDYKTLREHSTNVALFKEINGKIEKTKELRVTYSAAKNNLKSFVGSPCPDVIYPNYKDKDYAKVSLDSKSVTYLKNNISKFKDELLSYMLWQSMWDMVREGEYAVNDYISFASKNLGKIKDVKLAQATAGRLKAAYHYLASDTKTEKEFKDKTAADLEKLFWSQLKSAKKGSDFQKLWFKQYIYNSRSIEALGKITDILKKKFKFKGLEVDQDRRWDIVVQLNKKLAKNHEDVLAAEVKRDLSQKGQKKNMAAQVIRPIEKTKTTWFNKIFSEDKALTLAKKKVIMKYLFPSGQKAFAKAFDNEIYSKIPLMVKTKTDGFLRNFSRYLTPIACNKGSVDRLGSFVKANKDLTPFVYKNLRVGHQEGGRCVKIRDLSRDWITKKSMI